MKKLICFVFYTVLCFIMLILSFCAGRNSVQHNSKDYQAACIYRQCVDAITYHLDDSGKSEAEETIGSIMENLDCYPEITVTREEIENNYNINYVF